MTATAPSAEAEARARAAEAELLAMLDLEGRYLGLGAGQGEGHGEGHGEGQGEPPVIGIAGWQCALGNMAPGSSSPTAPHGSTTALPHPPYVPAVASMEGRGDVDG